MSDYGMAFINDLNELYHSRWTEALDNKRPPKRYEADYISWGKELSSAPSLTDFVLHGFSYDEAVRMQKLLYIEQLKSALEYKKGEMLYTPQELAAFDAVILRHIEEYNESA